MTTVRFFGSGDSFGDGGRFQACILLQHDGFNALLDCGASSLVPMKRAGFDPNDVDAVLVTHFHGDHSGGVPYLILDGQFRKRARPLVIAGPPGIQRRMSDIFEAALPTSSTTEQPFAISYLEYAPRPITVGPLSVLGLPVAHLPETEPHGLRVNAGPHTVAYTGDTDWCDALPRLADGADLLIAECYSIEKAIPMHLSHDTLAKHRGDLHAARVILTHPGVETLARRRELAWELAEDGTTLEL